MSLKVDNIDRLDIWNISPSGGVTHHVENDWYNFFRFNNFNLTKIALSAKYRAGAVVYFVLSLTLSCCH